MKKLLLIACLLPIYSVPVFAQDDDAEPSRSPPPPSIDVNALIERLADEMDREFILDRRMNGVFGGTTAGADADYETLLGILRRNGWYALETADQILIVPEATARSQPSRLLQEDDPNVSDHEIVTRIIELPDIEVQAPTRGEGGERETQMTNLAPMLVPILRPMMPQYAQLGNPAGTNKLVIVDRYDNVRRITAVIEAIVAGQRRGR